MASLDVRARSMAQACKERPGAMYALLGAAHEDAQGICDTCAQGEILVCANYNAPGQVVVSGDVAAIERAEKAWQALGKRGARLNAAGAFHSPLMTSASNAVREVQRAFLEAAYSFGYLQYRCAGFRYQPGRRSFGSSGCKPRSFRTERTGIDQAGFRSVC